MVASGIAVLADEAAQQAVWPRVPRMVSQTGKQSGEVDPAAVRVKGQARERPSSREVGVPPGPVDSLHEVPAGLGVAGESGAGDLGAGIEIPLEHRELGVFRTAAGERPGDLGLGSAPEGSVGQASAPLQAWVRSTPSGVVSHGLARTRVRAPMMAAPQGGGMQPPLVWREGIGARWIRAP